MSYVDNVIEQVKAKNAEQPEFIQAVTEVLQSLEPVIEAHPEYEQAALLERTFKSNAEAIYQTLLSAMTANYETRKEEDAT